MKPLILYRNTELDFLDHELPAMKKYFDVTDSRMNVGYQDLVIARYSCLPYYKELENDLKTRDATMINSYSEHQYIADLMAWVPDLDGLTPQTWNRLQDLPDEGPFVLKGKTNSKKFLWNTHMFAKTKKEATQVYLRLQDDELIGRQDIYIRRYVPLRKLSEGTNGLPICEEYRFFVCHGEVLCSGFYWSSHSEDLKEEGRYPNIDAVPHDFLQKIIQKIGYKAPFVVIDVARTESGDWIVIELNDGQMSGLSDIEPETLYRRLHEVVTCK